MFYIYTDGKLTYQPMDDKYILIEPKLTVEMGKAGSLTFKIPPTHPFYSQMNRLRTSVSVMQDETEIFYGRVLSGEKSFNNIRSIYCEGDLAYLIDSVQKAEKYTGTTHSLFRKIIAAHNSRVEAHKQFIVGDIGIEDRSVILTGQSEDINVGNIDYKQIAIDSIVDEWNNSFDYIQTCLIDYCGGYLRTRRVGNTTYIDLLENFGTNTSQQIELGVNMLDLNEEVTTEELFTVLIPLGDENLTIASVNNGSDELVDAAAVAQYGRIVRTHVFKNVNDPNTLIENGRRYLASNVNVPTTFSIKAVDMNLLDKDIDAIYLGDRVHIISTVHNIVDYLICTRIEYDLANPANTVYTFGNPKQTLTERYREDKRKQMDTYGNSASGSGGVSAAGAASSAAGSTAEKTEEENENALKDFYNAWIDLKPEEAKISLGTLYRDVEKGKTVLEQQCGIDINGVSGNINIKSFKQAYDETERKTSENTASIKLLQEETASSIELVTQRYNDLSNKEEQHYAELILIADSQGSAISMKSDQVTVDAAVINLNGQIQNLNAKYAEIDSLVSNKINSWWASLETLNVGTVFAEGFVYSTGKLVTTSDHLHTLSCDANGTVTLGAVVYGSGLSSFNIADTKYFRDAVSAAANNVTISLSRNPSKPDNYNPTYHTIDINILAKGSNGRQATMAFVVNANQAYNDGIAKGESNFYAVSVDVLGEPGYYYALQGYANFHLAGSAVPNQLYAYYDGYYYPIQQTVYFSGGYTGGLYIANPNSVLRYASGGTKTYYQHK